LNRSIARYPRIDKSSRRVYRYPVQNEGLASDIHVTGLHPCSYLAERTARTRFFYTIRIAGERYESLLNEGWRRSGIAVYKPVCPACKACMQLRVAVGEFEIRSSQKRVLAKNPDVNIRVIDDLLYAPAVELYRRYQVERHHAAEAPDTEDVQMFLGMSPVASRLMLYEIGDRLVGAGWIDILPDGLSSVYFAFESAEAKRSLGVFSILKEIELARSLGKTWLYLGYYVPGSRTMEYKADFTPHEILIGGTWTRAPSKETLRQAGAPLPDDSIPPPDPS
jgi:arginyl-tRNA--protein-N-Asp/Glu arginylyltransferase